MKKVPVLWLLVTIASVAFGLNLLWENIHIIFYEGYNTFSERFLRCVPAAGGDVLIILAIYLTLALLYGDWYWFARRTRAMVILTLVLGVGIAIAIEMAALSTGRWQYKNTMPLLPGTQFGLLPLIQMLFLPLTTFYIASKTSSRRMLKKFVLVKPLKTDSIDRKRIGHSIESNEC